jgi:hypothetical protein
MGVDVESFEASGIDAGKSERRGVELEVEGTGRLWIFRRQTLLSFFDLKRFQKSERARRSLQLKIVRKIRKSF